MDPTKRYPLAIVIPVLSSIEVAICIPPLLLHAKNRNFPAASYISWAILLNLFNIINALIWPNDDIDNWWDGTGLCDIEVKLMVAGYVAVPGSILCLFRGLANVLDTSRATLVPSKAQRWRNWAFDIIFCVIIPIITMILHLVWQKSRYLLFSISGCVNNFDESWPSMVLANMWPLPICLIAGYYCCLVLYRIRKYRSDFELILHASRSNLSKSRFLRLFCLAFITFITILPAEAYILYYDLAVSMPWHPYSWSQIHGPEWYVIQKYPTYGKVFFDRYIPLVMGFVVFTFFGFGRDATRMYRNVCWYLGLGYCFPSVVPLDSNASARPAHASNNTTLVESTASRAKHLFAWAKKRPSNNSSSTGSGSYNDIEKGTASSSSQTNNTKPRRSPWYLSWSRFSRRTTSTHDRDVLLDDISVPSQSQTIHTNAWAGTSQSRSSGEFASNVAGSPTWNDSIHVKQVISQQSEVQV